MATTTDQKLTLTEALAEAQSLGFTDVLFPVGWYPLTDISQRFYPGESQWHLITTNAVSYVSHQRMRKLSYQLRKGGE